jgi:hypothetical protein
MLLFQSQRLEYNSYDFNAEILKILYLVSKNIKYTWHRFFATTELRNL